jgi:hypothetical protein
MTDWQTTPSKQHDVRFLISLEGEGPYRVMLDSETRVCNSKDNRRFDISKFGGKRSLKFEEQLKKTIRKGLEEFASDCDGFMLKSTCDERPVGTSKQFRVPANLPAGVEIHSPLDCEFGSAYIRVKRLKGDRKLDIDHQKGALHTGCHELPKNANDLSLCPIVNSFALLHKVYEQLRRAGITTVGTGLGPCGRIGDDYHAWNLSVAVLRWEDAARAVRLLAELMTKYDISGYLGVAVSGYGCGTLTFSTGMQKR